MTDEKQDWQAEEQRVTYVVEKVMDKIKELEGEIGDVRSEAVEFRKHFWDEVTVNFSTAEDLTETYFSMKQQADLLAERERTQRHSAAYLDKLKRLKDSPYFGRIDFREEQEQAAEAIYLGIASFREEGNDSFLVYDWRAPVSSLYYDYPPGPAAYKTPSGEVSGELALKRQFIIRGGQMQIMFDTGVTIGDELLKRMLSRTSDAQMKSIVATIQREQNRIIRNERARMLVVQGAAGSGKTSAALQRVAYLLYRYRGVLTADQMVLFSPNPMFNSYVASVLPELGEENMLQTTFQEYLELRLEKEFQLEDSFDQLEYVLTAARDEAYAARMSAIRYKSSSDFLVVIHNYLDSLLEKGMMFRTLLFKGHSIVSAKEMNDYFYGLDRSIRLANRLVLLKDWLLERITAYESGQLNEPWVEAAIQLLEPEDYQRAYNYLRKKQKASRRENTFDDYDIEKEWLAKLVVSDAFKPLRRKVKQMRFVDAKGLYRRLFANAERFKRLSGQSSLPEHFETFAQQTVLAIDEKRLTYEDMTPYLYLNERMKGFRANTAVRHVVIDEAQDYTPFQLEFMKWLFPRSQMTALGDLNQAIYSQTTSAMAEHDPLTALFGPEDTEWIRLTRSYRSTKEIVEFTRGMVPGGEAIEPFNRSGELPKVHPVIGKEHLAPAIVKEARKLQEEGFESIAVICKTAAESSAAHNELSRELPFRLVTKETASFEKGLCIIPAYLAKGVEFDAVLIYDASSDVYKEENERKLFYTACTRAMHTLLLFTAGELCRFAAEQPASTCQQEEARV